jgi:DNA-binding NarL/FixJ family response regulator
MASPKTSSARRRARILLVDDHPIMVQGLTQLINEQADMEVCGAAPDTARAMQLAGSLNPDLVIVDISLQGADGIHLLKDLKARHPGLLTMVLSLHEESLYAERALRAGARGYVMKQAPPVSVMTAIRRVLAGEMCVSDKIAHRILEQAMTPHGALAASPVETLSDRELEVFRLIGRGRSTKEIADELHLSIKTVESYRAHIKDKLQIATAAELIQQATLWIQSEEAA